MSKERLIASATIGVLVILFLYEIIYKSGVIHNFMDDFQNQPQTYQGYRTEDYTNDVEPSKKALKVAADTWIDMSEEEKSDTKSRFNTNESLSTIRKMAIYFDAHPEALVLAESLHNSVKTE